jgi:hypothetical protein
VFSKVKNKESGLITMPKFDDPKFLQQMRDISIKKYQQTGSRSHLLKANECNWKLDKIRKAATAETASVVTPSVETVAAEEPAKPAPKKRGRPRKKEAQANA